MSKNQSKESELIFATEIVQLTFENISSSEEIISNLTQTPVHDYSEILSQNKFEYEKTSNRPRNRQVKNDFEAPGKTLINPELQNNPKQEILKQQTQELIEELKEPKNAQYKSKLSRED